MQQIDTNTNQTNQSKATKPPKKRKLTPKEQLFVDIYIRSYPECNATKCAKEAGYSQKTATEIAYELLNKPHIASLIDIEIEKKRAKVMLSKEDFMAKVEQLYTSTDNINGKCRLLDLQSRILGHDKPKESTSVNIFQDIGSKMEQFAKDRQQKSNDSN